MADKEHIAQVFAEALADAQRLVVDRMHTAIQDAEGTADTSKRRALEVLSAARKPASELADLLGMASTETINVPDVDAGATFDDVRSFIDRYGGEKLAAVEVGSANELNNLATAVCDAVHQAIAHLETNTEREAAE